MDKLKPILAQKFWILFSMVLIMPMAGYFMTKGKLAAEIDDRLKKLNDSFGGIPAGTGVPNDSWTTRVNDINKQQELHNRRANQELWAKQKEVMSWPKDVAPIMAKAEYFKELTQEQKGDQVLFKYPLSYRSQILALWEIVDPLDDGMNLRDSDKRRKVAFPMADLQQSSVMLAENPTPTFSQIWAAQEDIWLQTELLQAIRRLNANSISQGDAFVKQLGKIQLFGGIKSTGDAGASTASGMSGGAGGDMSGAMFGGAGFGGATRSESTTLSADINLSEEFNAEMEVSGGGGGGNSGAGGFGGAGAGGAMAEMSAGGAGGGAKAETKRYIDFLEDQPYKRRGFSIKLVMDHRKVPDLIAELMNSPFSVEIVRVQQAWLSDSGNTSGGNQMGGPGAGGFAGFKTNAGGDAGNATAPTAGFTEGDGAGAGAGFNNLTSSGAGGRSGTSGAGSATAMTDPNLAQVSIVGVWTLYRPPLPAADGGQIAPPNSVAPAATRESVTSPAAIEAETATADSKPTTTEPTEGTGDEPKKADAPGTPKSDPAKPEKSESESDKSEVEKSPSKEDAADKSDSEAK